MHIVVLGTIRPNLDVHTNVLEGKVIILFNLCSVEYGYSG